MSKQFIVIVIVIVLGLFGVLMLTREKTETGGDTANNAQATNHTVGAGESGVTLIEYGDFQCPACGAFYPLVNQIKEDYGDQITFQYRHFPLTQIHPNAFIASRAAEAASKQDKFFEMHDLLFEGQSVWSSTTDPTETFVGYANQLQLNIEQFRADMTAKATADTINADIKEAQAAGASSTPTFVLNGRKLDKNPASIDEFKQLIDEEIAKANQ